MRSETIIRMVNQSISFFTISPESKGKAPIVGHGFRASAAISGSYTATPQISAETAMM